MAKLKFNRDFIIPDKNPVIVEIECEMINKSFLGYNYGDEELYIRKIINTKHIEKDDFGIVKNRQLLFSVYKDNSKDLIQFLMFINTKNADSSYPEGFPPISDLLTWYSMREDDYRSHKVLKNMYFEASLSNFIKLFDIN